MRSRNKFHIFENVWNLDRYWASCSSSWDDCEAAQDETQVDGLNKLKLYCRVALEMAVRETLVLFVGLTVGIGSQTFVIDGGLQSCPFR